eukprot:GHVL01001573.1.p1 GENE.GHVL01001573.1~~GHVL01001573.1.p1  ORF type:complete len:140 (+),score=7.14 GHVL01001573.1:327-746(+)
MEGLRAKVLREIRIRRSKMACSGTVIELLLYFVDSSQTKAGGENAFLGGKVRLRVGLSEDEIPRYVDLCCSMPVLNVGKDLEICSRSLSLSEIIDIVDIATSGCHSLSVTSTGSRSSLRLAKTETRNVFFIPATWTRLA